MCYFLWSCISKCNFPSVWKYQRGTEWKAAGRKSNPIYQASPFSLYLYRNDKPTPTKGNAYMYHMSLESSIIHLMFPDSLLTCDKSGNCLRDFLRNISKILRKGSWEDFIVYYDYIRLRFLKVNVVLVVVRT